MSNPTNNPRKGLRPLEQKELEEVIGGIAPGGGGGGEVIVKEIGNDFTACVGLCAKALRKCLDDKIKTEKQCNTDKDACVSNCLWLYS